jgi:hypothetical protein
MSDIKGPWDINGNGYAGQLWIEGVDSKGNLLPSSSVFEGDRILGFWDDTANKLTFMRYNDGDPSSFQIYTGYLMKSQADGSLAFAGSFEAFQGTGATAKISVYGWYAMRKS